MNTRTRIFLGLVACVAATGMAWAADANPQDQAPGPSPTQASVWMSGHWNSDAGQWKWTAGHWETPPSPSATWIEGHWVASGGGWVWANGAWNVGSAAQSSTNPPLPPSQPATEGSQVSNPGAQAVPMVSSPAPYVQGQYVPGSQPAVVYQQAVVTDYGPIDYSYGDYPGYYYGNPYFWGGYPYYGGIGIGIGPIFFGGRGYYRGGYYHGGGHYHAGAGHVGGHVGGGGHIH